MGVWVAIEKIKDQIRSHQNFALVWLTNPVTYVIVVVYEMRSNSFCFQTLKIAINNGKRMALGGVQVSGKTA